MKPTTRHPYHCTLCGKQLYEATLGILFCKECGHQFLPTVDDSGRQYSLTWISSSYGDLSDDQIDAQVIARIMEWTDARGCDDIVPVWKTTDGKILRGSDYSLKPTLYIDDAMKAYKELEGPYELHIEEMKIPGPDWYVGIEIYEPKPEMTVSEKGDSLPRTLCVAMLKVLDDAVGRLQPCSVCGHRPADIEDLCEHVKAPVDKDA
jgi:hypothetical protein